MKERQIEASNTGTIKQAGKLIHSANNQSGPPNVLLAGHVVPPRGFRRISSKRQLLQSGATRSQECGAFPAFIPENSRFGSILVMRKHVRETQKPDFLKKSGFCVSQICDSSGISGTEVSLLPIAELQSQRSALQAFGVLSKCPNRLCSCRHVEAGNAAPRRFRQLIGVLSGRLLIICPSDHRCL